MHVCQSLTGACICGGRTTSIVVEPYGKSFTVRTKMNINGKTFTVAASFNNEMSNLVNDSTKNVRG